MTSTKLNTVSKQMSSNMAYTTNLQPIVTYCIPYHLNKIKHCRNTYKFFTNFNLKISTDIIASDLGLAKLLLMMFTKISIKFNCVEVRMNLKEIYLKHCYKLRGN